MPKLFVLLPVHNRKTITLQFIYSLKSQNYKNFQLILIDDGSWDGTSVAVQEQLKSTIVIRGDGNLWWGGSLQKGYLWLLENEIAPDSFILIINDDTMIESDFFSSGVSYLTKHQKTLLLAEAFSKQTGNKIDQGININWFLFKFNPLPKAGQINCLSTRGLFFRMSDFIKIGGFYPEKLPHYCSDYEFTVRAKNKGYQLTTTPSFRLFVDETTTGIHQVKDKSLKKYLKTLFSIRSAKNPIILSRFVLMSAPFLAIPFALMRIWIGGSIRLFSCIHLK